MLNQICFDSYIFLDQIIIISCDEQLKKRLCHPDKKNKEPYLKKNQ